MLAGVDCPHPMSGFFAEVNAAGVIPVSLLRWQLTGRDDEIRELLRAN